MNLDMHLDSTTNSRDRTGMTMFEYTLRISRTLMNITSTSILHHRSIHTGSTTTIPASCITVQRPSLKTESQPSLLKVHTSRISSEIEKGCPSKISNWRILCMIVLQLTNVQRKAAEVDIDSRVPIATAGAAAVTMSKEFLSSKTANQIHQ